MTVITKLSDKKEDKLVLPLVDNDQLATAPPEGDVESQNADPSFIILRARVRRVSHTTTLTLLIAALTVVALGITGGLYVYRQHIRSQVFKGWCAFPYDQALTRNEDDIQQLKDLGLRQELMAPWGRQSDEDDFQKSMRDLEDFPKMDGMDGNIDLFNERFEINMDDDYEKIDVPDFRDGRNGRFVHDFNINMTGIIDTTGHRCFVMPLNRENVLPPKSMYDLISKMWEGYYKVNTEVVKETMRVVTPPITDKEEVGAYIWKECSKVPIYKLEKIVSGVVKRSADLHEMAKFAQFSGFKITEVDIVNLEDAEAYEQHSH